MKQFKKLADVQVFTVEKIYGFQYQKWDGEKMIKQDKWEEGFRKTYDVECTDFKLTLSSAQVGNMLEAAMQGGKSDIVGKSFNVKTNGQTGKEIRYYINLNRTAQPPVQPPVQSTEPNGDMAQQFNESQQNDLPF